MELMNIATALAEFQAQITNPPKNKTVAIRSDKGSFSFNYADLTSILDHIKPVMKKCGLALYQNVTVIDGLPVLESRLMHESGESLVGHCPIKTSGTDKELGSEITYRRRYALVSMLGLSAEDDNDVGAPDKDAAIKDDLMNIMAEAGIGNRPLMNALEALGKNTDGAKSVGSLDVKLVKFAIDHWDEVLKVHKENSSAGSTKKEAPAKKPAAAKTAKKVVKGSGNTTATEGYPEGMNADLRSLMEQASVTADALVKYVVKKGHLPAEMKLEDYPDDYIEKLIMNWAKVLPNLKG